MIPRDAATFTADVVLPTPPFWLEKDIIFPNLISPIEKFSYTSSLYTIFCTFASGFLHFYIIFMLFAVIFIVCFLSRRLVGCSIDMSNRVDECFT
jgi:hypothetical protein